MPFLLEQPLFLNNATTPQERKQAWAAHQHFQFQQQCGHANMAAPLVHNADPRLHQAHLARRPSRTSVCSDASTFSDVSQPHLPHEEHDHQCEDDELFDYDEEEDDEDEINEEEQECLAQMLQLVSANGAALAQITQRFDNLHSRLMNLEHFVEENSLPADHSEAATVPALLSDMNAVRQDVSTMIQQREAINQQIQNWQQQCSQ